MDNEINSRIGSNYLEAKLPTGDIVMSNASGLISFVTCDGSVTIPFAVTDLDSSIGFTTSTVPGLILDFWQIFHM